MKLKISFQLGSLLLSTCPSFAVSRGNAVPTGSPLFRSIVRLEIDDSICTGTLISSCSVLTAAHCFRKTDGGAHPITFFGARDARVQFLRSNDAAPILDERARSVKIHPGYAVGHRGRYGWSQCHDLAVVQIPCVDARVALPMALAVKPGFANAPALVAGFGDQGKGAGVLPLNRANDDADPLKQARAVVKSISMANGCLVVAPVDGRVEAGDSGGPLMSRQENGAFLLEGVLSGNPHAPTDPYTSVPNFRSWIEEAARTFSR